MATGGNDNPYCTTNTDRATASVNGIASKQHKRHYLNEVEYSLNSVANCKIDVIEASDFSGLESAITFIQSNILSTLRKMEQSIEKPCSESVGDVRNSATIQKEVYHRRHFNDIQPLTNTLTLFQKDISQAENSQQMNDAVIKHIPIILALSKNIAPSLEIAEIGAPPSSDSFSLEACRRRLLNYADHLEHALKLLKGDVSEANSVHEILDSVIHHSLRINHILKELGNFLPKETSSQTPSSCSKLVRVKLEEFSDQDDVHKISEPSGHFIHDNLRPNEVLSKIPSTSNSSIPITDESSSGSKTKINPDRKWKRPQGSVPAAYYENIEIESATKRPKRTSSSTKEIKSVKNDPLELKDIRGAIVSWIQGNTHSYGFIHAGKKTYYVNEKSLIGNFGLLFRGKSAPLSIPVIFNAVPAEGRNNDRAVNVRRA